MTVFSGVEHLFQALPRILPRGPSFAARETMRHEEPFLGHDHEGCVTNVQGPLYVGGLPLDPPLTPFDPFHPRNPLERRPLPQRPFRDSWLLDPEPWLPFFDVCEGVSAIPILLELPRNAKVDSHLTVALGNVDGTVKTVSKPVHTVTRIDVDQASSRDGSGVLSMSLSARASRVSMGGSPRLGDW